VVEVRDGRDEPDAAGELDEDAIGASSEPEVRPLRLDADQRLAERRLLPYSGLAPNPRWIE